MNARVGPVSFPAIQISLRVFQALEALPFERCPFCVADAGFDFAFAIRVLHSAWKRGDAVVLQHVTVQRIERGLVNIGREHALAQRLTHFDLAHKALSLIYLWRLLSGSNSVVECQLPKLDVAGSSPVSRSKINNLQTAQKHTLHSPPLRITADLFRARKPW